MTKIFSKICFTVSAIAMLIPFSIAMTTSNVNPNIASAAPVYACPTGETLSGMDCVINVNTSPTFATQCPSGSTEMLNICTQRTAKVCTDFYKMVVAEAGLCRIDPTQTTNVVLGDVSDSDGRYCRAQNTPTFNSPSLFNVKNYKNATGGAIKVCANGLDVLDKTTFRLEPFTIEMIRDYVTTQTGTTNSLCPTGYTAFNNNTQCKRPAVARACDMAGEYFATSGCVPCVAGQYCPMPNANNTSTVTICPNGGMLSADKTKCTAQNKIATTTYTDGCPSGLIKMDQTCSIEEIRTVNINSCTYFYASSNENLKASDANPSTRTQDGNSYKMCTGNNVSNPSATYTPTSAEISLASPLQCLGAGSQWYNYNVFLDPLVCGVGTVGTTGFVWTAKTFSKITPLQKIPSTTLICPNGWMEMDATTCHQPPITVEYKGPIPCPINTYSMAGASSCIVCPNGGTSPAGSMSLAACITPPVTPPPAIITTSSTSLNVVTINLPTPPPAPKIPCVSPMGSYTNSNGDCVPCPAGTMSMNPGSKSINDCIKIMTCADFLARGMGDFKIGDVNYSRERDMDNNGIACELPKMATVTTVRTGGNQIFSTSMLVVAIISALIGLVLVKKENQFSNNWSKIK